MAHATIHFVSPYTGQARDAPVGFSWTVSFFVFFPPLFRRDWAGFAILLMAAIVTLGFAGLIFMFIYNNMYLRFLISDGFKAESATVDLDCLQQELGFPIPRIE
jgi:hypothetical protein